MKTLNLMNDVFTLANKNTIVGKLEWIKVCVLWKIYSIFNLGFAAKVKMSFALVLAKLGLRKKVNRDLEFPELEWDTDIYG